jgi:hypothetical protein
MPQISPISSIAVRKTAGRDRAGIGLRFTIPTVVDGRVYVGAKGELDVYGLLSAPREPGK